MKYTTIENYVVMEKEIKVEKDFVVTYNCHTDEYIVKGSGPDSKVQGWQTYADHTVGYICREILRGFWSHSSSGT